MARPPLLRTSDVFVPGKLPAHTYNPRDEFELEQSLHDYVEEAGSILTLAGPTKTGKTVLLRTVLESPVWVDGQGIDGPEELWARIADEMGLFLNQEQSTSDTMSAHAEGGISSSVPTLLRVNIGGGADTGTTNASRFSAQRNAAVMARDALRTAGRPLVIDDFHFVDRAVQKQIVRALKPLVLAGLPIVFVSISHRIREVVSAEPDMTGRVSTLVVDFWTVDDLLVIARKGFAALNVLDPGERIAKRLAKESYGSPHLMQQFCREICKHNGVRETARNALALSAPQWNDFFPGQAEDASASWAARLLRGPLERGSLRTKYRTTDGLELDGYGLTLAAVAATGPKLGIPKDQIRAKIAEMVVGSPPASNQTTSVLKNMSRIAARRLTEADPSEEDLEGDPADADVQPVLDFVDEGPTSSLHIADPFFAFYLAWGLQPQLEELGRSQE
jgi:hypothetical protein